MNELLQVIKDYFPLFLAGGNVALFCVVKFNDMQHLGVDLKALTKVVEKHTEKVDSVIERIAKIEGKCSANHGN